MNHKNYRGLNCQNKQDCECCAVAENEGRSGEKDSGGFVTGEAQSDDVFEPDLVNDYAGSDNDGSFGFVEP